MRVTVRVRLVVLVVLAAASWGLVLAAAAVGCHVLDRFRVQPVFDNGVVERELGESDGSR